MKGFIKITDVNQHDHYLNINYVIKFMPSGQRYKGNAVLFLTGGEKTVAIVTLTTVEEIVDMIDLAR